jgi:hypothetical protein
MRIETVPEWLNGDASRSNGADARRYRIDQGFESLRFQ